MIKTLTAIHILALLTTTSHPATTAQVDTDTSPLPLATQEIVKPKAQNLHISSTAVIANVSRDNYEIIAPPKPKPKPKPEPVTVIVTASSTQSKTVDNTTTNPAITLPTGPTIPKSQVQSFAHDQVIARGWSEEDYSCLVLLWNKESGWNYKAENTSSGAYGIPQALPGSKMASAGADWASNGETQVTWGLNYIAGSYGTPCKAWEHSEANGWY